jgi:hypothetical protein
MLLVGTLNIQPTFNPDIHTHIYIPQDHDASPQQDRHDETPTSTSSLISSFFLNCNRSWLTALPHVEPPAEKHRNHTINVEYAKVPWFMYDSLLAVTTEVVLTTQSVLFSLCNDDETR